VLLSQIKKDRLILKKWAYPSPKNGGVKIYSSLVKGLKILVPNRYILSLVYVTPEAYLPCCVNFVYFG